jgi:tellurite resistance protein TehA-like permease
MAFGSISIIVLALTIVWILVVALYRHALCKRWRLPEYNRRHDVVPVVIDRRRYCKKCGAEVTGET